LLVLDHSDVPLTPGQIAAYVFREQHSVSAQLSRMWRAGLVKKTRSKSDQRVVKVKITSKGKELLDHVKPPGLGLAQSILQSCFSEKELPAFDAQLKKVRDSALQRLSRELKPSPSGFRIPRTQAECGLTGR
ncbi:MAG: MarR family winged helix-turn-helix transcriptional regulator, partial [Chloroflexi bacterium]|nr:MarR family winged helix-turn-helix transcriptional regulator [Chloroflexota bacterium]